MTECATFSTARKEVVKLASAAEATNTGSWGPCIKNMHLDPMNEFHVH